MSFFERVRGRLPGGHSSDTHLQHPSVAPVQDAPIHPDDNGIITEDPTLTPGERMLSISDGRQFKVVAATLADSNEDLEQTRVSIYKKIHKADGQETWEFIIDYDPKQVVSRINAQISSDYQREVDAKAREDERMGNDLPVESGAPRILFEIPTVPTEDSLEQTAVGAFVYQIESALGVSTQQSFPFLDTLTPYLGKEVADVLYPPYGYTLARQQRNVNNRTLEIGYLHMILQQTTRPFFV